jgi:hypothetical protein
MQNLDLKTDRNVKQEQFGRLIQSGWRKEIEWVERMKMVKVFYKHV